MHDSANHGHPDFAIRPATPADAPLLTTLGARLFEQSFGPNNLPENMAAYLSSAFSVGRQEAELRDPEVRVWIVEAAGEAIGYAHLRRGDAPTAVAGRRPVELARFYVDRPWHGRGVAQALMAACVAGARDLGGDVLWLGVWERNPRAIAFYGKCGFRNVGTQPFQLGADPQTDQVMARPLDEPDREGNPLPRQPS